MVLYTIKWQVHAPIVGNTITTVTSFFSTINDHFFCVHSISFIASAASYREQLQIIHETVENDGLEVFVQLQA